MRRASRTIGAVSQLASDRPLVIKTIHTAQTLALALERQARWLARLETCRPVSPRLSREAPR